MKIITIVGARPQFIKAAVFSRAVKNWNSLNTDKTINEIIIHTGQHYDHNMSKIFFDELGIPTPDYDLEIAGGMHGSSTGQMLTKIEQVLIKEKPDWVLVYGDTNSTLAGALAAAKLHINVAHIEAGLRSFNKNMPEEINRILTDHITKLAFCPTETAVEHLKNEGITEGVYNVGDIMLDASIFYRNKALQKSNILNQLGIKPKEYVLATCHRAENTDDVTCLANIVESLSELSNRTNVILPLHPRTKNALIKFDLFKNLGNIKVIEPVSFLDMIKLEEHADFIVTDSGGVQKEAYFFKVPCITLRNETEWVETVSSGWNQIVGTNILQITKAFTNIDRDLKWPSFYGEGDAGIKILQIILQR